MAVSLGLKSFHIVLLYFVPLAVYCFVFREPISRRVPPLLSRIAPAVACVLCYGIEADGTLTAQPARDYHARPGSGPRHLAFARDGKTAYVMNELDSTVTAVRYSADGVPGGAISLSTLPPEGSQTSTGACIRLNRAGTYLYASNRGHNSIAVFRVADGAFEQAGCYDCHGAIPRDFAITPDDRFLICANQSSDALSVFALDAQTGALRLIQTAPLPTPVCVAV